MIDKAVREALGVISGDRILEHIKTLASDEFEGRKPGTQGEVRTVEYLIKQCKQLGLVLGDALGGYLQKMAVTGVQTQATVAFKGADGELVLKRPEDVVARCAHATESGRLDSDVVFVGYGIQAPEYGWDDYKGTSVKGKTVIMLIGDPRRADSKDSSRFDDTFFKGRALTYYGRWTYKFEKAFELGAAAVLIVHDTERAGYGYDVVNASWGGENLFLSADEERTNIEGWLSGEAARKVFSAGGQDFEQLHAIAQTPQFRPVALNGKLHISFNNTIRRFLSSNVIAKIEGSDKQLQEECIVYCAHWDHFGKVVDAAGNTVGIYSGAADNGSGVATILEIARAYQALPQPPKRTIYFLFTTLEEYGLLGARYFVNHPPVLLDNTLAVLNFDSLNMWGRTRKIVSTAAGHSSLDEVLVRHAATQNREVIGDPEPEKGYFFRSDHLEFLRKHVPALFLLNPGAEYVDKPPEYGAEKRSHYLRCDYHKFTDKVKPDWDLSGTAEDAQLMFVTGLDIANAESKPEWKPESEFKPARSAAWATGR